MILPQLQEALVVASDQMVARRRRRTQRFRLGLMTSAAVVTLGGGAVASQTLWAPLLGWEDGNRPSVSHEPAPAAQADRLGVLRREQTAADRGPAARTALTSMSRRYVGVRVSAVRVIADGRGASSVLVPVTTAKGTTAGVAAKSRLAAQTRDDALCLHVVYDDAAAGGALRCFTTADLAQGGAMVLSGETIRGVTPDGVARVRFSGARGVLRDVPVRDNLFVTSFADVEGATRLSWVAADGRPVPLARGAASHPVTIPVVAPELPRNVHDCGKALGGVVPRTIPCGPRSRRYVPEVGDVQYFSQKP